MVEQKRSDGRLLQLGDQKELPGWLLLKHGYSIWNRANLWMLECALSRDPKRLTVMALWEGEAGAGPGGTADLIEAAEELGATSIIKTDSICPSPQRGHN
jgi:hypothetical protein